MLIRNGACDAENGDHDEDGDISAIRTLMETKHYCCNRIWTSLLIVAMLMMVVLIPRRISSTGISKGDMVIKNTTSSFSKGLDGHEKNDVNYVAGINHQLWLSGKEEQPICVSLDKSMPLLLSILRGGKDRLVSNESNPLITATYQYGYLIPFDAEQRLLSTPPNVAISKNTKLVVVPGFNYNLISRTFLGKRTYFIGDSTSRVLFVALRQLLVAIHQHHPESSSSEAESSESIWHDGQWVRNLTVDFKLSKHQWRTEGLASYMFENDGTYLELFDVSPLYFQPTRQSRKDNSTRKANLQNDFLEMLKVKLVKPDAIIFNAGMHLLHLTPMRTLTHETYASWVHYETLLDKLLQVGLDSGASAMIAKSTNRICSGKFPKDLNQFVKAYHQAKPEGKACQDFVETQEKDEQQIAGNVSFTILSESQREEICKFGTFDESGSSFLNQRMSKWLNETRINRSEELALEDDGGRDSRQTTKTTSNPRSRLQYFNDHDIESCDYTEERDGRHFMKLSLVRLHLLAILLDCVLPG